MPEEEEEDELSQSSYFTAGADMAAVVRNLASRSGSRKAPRPAEAAPPPDHPHPASQTDAAAGAADELFESSHTLSAEEFGRVESYYSGGASMLDALATLSKSASDHRPPTSGGQRPGTSSGIRPGTSHVRRDRGVTTWVDDGEMLCTAEEERAARTLQKYVLEFLCKLRAAKGQAQPKRRPSRGIFYKGQSTLEMQSVGGRPPSRISRAGRSHQMEVQGPTLCTFEEDKAARTLQRGLRQLVSGKQPAARSAHTGVQGAGDEANVMTF
eukprot:TRINITY_DN12791_c0_g1_i3.p1 TRINITY_DN12791_c0_g1~~TRINITY_DN12791_c0_g1_i3.p1  ORF type:complete len:286 (+),score=79.47 TRINITY_DN12791_c0_g1_i3:54-860(+)